MASRLESIDRGFKFAKHRQIIIEIQKNLWKQVQNANMLIQWIPSHVQIIGNEVADKAAKNTPNLQIVNPIRIPYKDIAPLCKNATHKLWKQTD